MGWSKRKVAAVVVTYNRAAQLLRCLDAIINQEDRRCDGIVVLDNGSTDGTEEVLAPYIRKYGIVHVDVGENYGSAGGFHLGVYAALMLGYDLIWVMDDDVVPDENALATLLDADLALAGEWGFLSSVAYWEDGSICRPNIQKKGLFSFVGRSDYALDNAPVKIASMASLLLQADVVRKVGLPIAEYFFYTDDYEYTGRISRSYPCYMVTASRVLHEMKANEKPNLAKSESERLWRYRFLYRNDVHFYRRFGIRGWAYLATKAAYTTMNVLVNEQAQKTMKLGILWSGLAKGLAFQPSIVYPYDCGLVG